MKNNILVIKHGAFGDVILAGAAMEAIRTYHKNDYITCLTTEHFRKILEESPWFDKVVSDLKPRWNDIKGWQNLKLIFHKYNFTTVYDLQTSYRSNLIYIFLFSFLLKILSGVELHTEVVIGIRVLIENLCIQQIGKKLN